MIVPTQSYPIPFVKRIPYECASDSNAGGELICLGNESYAPFTLPCTGKIFLRSLPNFIHWCPHPSNFRAFVYGVS